MLRASTFRLDLIPATLAHLLAELESPERLASLLGATIGPGWPPGEYDRGAQEFFRDRLAAGGDDAVGWYAWYAVRRAEADAPAVVVGGAGFLGPPDEDGDVEIGYSIVESFRRQGYAGEIVQALVDVACGDPRVRRVLARTTAANSASIAVLERAGFVASGGADEEGSLKFTLVRPPARS